MSQTLESRAATLDRYDLELFMLPYWEGGLVCCESVLPLEDESGHAAATLLYDATRVLSVRDSSLAVEYEEGKDWEYRDGQLHVLKGGRIEAFTYDWFHADTYKVDYPVSSVYMYENGQPNGKLSRIYHGFFGHEHMLHVTYTHNGTWQGEKPAYCGDLLPRTMAKLRAGQSPRVIIYGDSISHCDESSGSFGVNRAPFIPGWPDMACAMLEQDYGVPVELINLSVGGWSSENGLHGGYECYQQKDVPGAVARVAPLHPDLVVIGFGQNDRCDPDHLRENMIQLMTDIRTGNPDVEFIISTPVVPNPGVSMGEYPSVPFYQDQYRYQDALLPLEGPGVAVIPMKTYQEPLIARKTFSDLFNNNINHPSDFFYRLFAQVLYAALAKQS